jgi:alanine dehydrogenase
LHRALAEDPALALGVNVAAGEVTCQPVAEAVGLEYTPLDTVLPLRVA